MTEETLKRAIKYKKEIDSITDFVREAMSCYGFTLSSNRHEYWVCDIGTKELILKIVKERRSELEKELEEM